jgi:cytochrome b
LLLQVTSGLLSDDEIAWSGPLSKFVSSVLVGNATFYHKNVGKLLLIALVLMHIGAIVFYLVKKRENLVRPMIHGDKITPIAVESSRDDAASRALAALIFGLCAALVAGLVTWAG